MRIALAPSRAIGLRAGRCLLADSNLEALGVYDADVRSQDERVETIHGLEGWDAVVSDAGPEDHRLRQAVALEVPIVTTRSLREVSPAAAGTPLIAAASPQSGLPAALAVQMMQLFDTVRTVTAAVTVEPRRVRRHHSAVFPAPVGAQWCEPVPTPVASPKSLSFAHAPYDGVLAAISVQAEGEIDGQRHTEMRGVVDDPLFLGAITLAGAALMALDDSIGDRQIEVQERATDYLAACIAAGLGVASFKAG